MITEILYVRNPGFIVDVSKLSVPLVHSGAVEPMKNSQGNSLFERGDSMNLISVGLLLPYEFSLSGTVQPEGETPEKGSLPEVNLSAMTVQAGQTTYHSFPGFNHSALPFTDYECSIGAFLDSSEIPLEFELLFTLTRQSCRVSMIGVPSTLDGKYFDVVLFAKIAHNRPLKTELVG